MVRSRVTLLLVTAALALGAVWWALRQTGSDPSPRPPPADRTERRAAPDRGGLTGRPKAEDWAQDADEPDDPLPLPPAVTEADYGLREPPRFTSAERADHRREFRRRLARLALPGDPELADCLTLVRWAADKEIPALYGLALRYTLILHGQSTEARGRLNRLRRTLRRLPVDRQAGLDLLSDLGHDFRLLRTPHFRVAYDTEEPFAQQIGALLEQVHRAFFRFFRARHFEPVPPDDRLEVVIFARQTDYRRFTASLGKHLASTSGVFVGADNRTYFYDALSEPALERSRQNVATSVRRLRGFLQDVEDAASDRRFDVTVGGRSHRRVSRRLARELLRGELQRLQRTGRRVARRFDGRNTSRAVHEIVHHLAYAAGIHGRFRSSPTWLVEGLAMHFEAVDPLTGRWIGPGAVNRPRQRGHRRDVSAGRAPSLDDLVSSDRGFRAGGRAMNRTYNAAWALFDFLVRRHHDALFDLMANLSIEVATERASADDRRQEFARAFGRLRALERSWRADPGPQAQ